MTHDTHRLTVRLLRSASATALMIAAFAFPLQAQQEEVTQLSAAWEDTEWAGSGLTAASVTLTQRQTTFVIGNLAESAKVTGDGDAALIRAFDARSGELLWSDQRQALEDVDSFELMTTGVTKGRHLVVGGVHYGPEGHQVMVWAYDSRTGERRWSWQSEPRLEASADALALGNGRVVFASYERDEPLLRRERVRAFSLKTGALEWVHETDALSYGGHGAAARGCLAVAGRRVAFAGNLPTQDSRLEVLDLRDGDVIWTHAEAGVALTQFSAVVRHRGRFVVGGVIDGRPHLVALSVRDGELVWTKSLFGSSAGIVRTLTAGRRSLVAAITAFPNMPTSMLESSVLYHGSFDDFISLTQVFSLHPAKGELRWSSVPHGVDQPGTSNHALRAVIQGRRLALLTTPFEPAANSLIARMTLFNMSTGEMTAMAETPLSKKGVLWTYLADVALTRTHAILGTSLAHGMGWWNVEGFELDQ
jgi:outer membrane protein assembly factor BamB